jgi:hypothetical protein
MRQSMAERPVEPFSESENPEQWAAIVAWEESRADKAEAENKRLREALENIAKHGKDSITPVDWRNIVLIIGDIARAALDGSLSVSV